MKRNKRMSSLLISSIAAVSIHRAAAAVALAAGLSLLAAAGGAEPEPPPQQQPTGMKFVPTDVDWDHPVYETNFDDSAALKDWRLEGGLRMGVANGSLVLESKPGSTQSEPDADHLVCWLTKEMPADFLLQFSVRPENRKQGLNIVFFNTRGLGGESIFDPALSPRDGLFKQYHSGDLNGYHISYWAAGRGTAHVRKNRGFHLVAQGTDLVTEGPAGAFQTVRVYKRGGQIRCTVDDVVSIAYDDDGTTFGPVWKHGGWIGLRQMGHTVRCEYGDLKVWPLKAGPERWQKAIEAFEAADKVSPPPQGAILFIGSSTIVRWKTLAEDFPEHQVINRGFGGSQIADSVFYADRIVIPYRPRMIVLRAGGNDIHAGKTPEEVAADFKAFVEKVRARLPEVRIAYMTINASPSRWANVEREKRANQLIKEYIASGENMDYIDTFDATLGADGAPREDLFVKDRLHFNEEGYKILASIVRRRLK